ncbi:MAG: epoxyqueuosine reductase QueH [Slackia faecicanis]|nr:epoxyqueuosine reductase QueH [Slackia faecicanis]
MKLLLHACCGPCSLEPLRLLLEAGHDITIAYMNSNIHPAAEYDHRLQTMLEFAESQGIAVIEGPYDPQAWANAAGVYGTDPDARPDRCRACYRLRFDEAARYAAEHGFEGLATTLSVSPYQYIDLIAEELSAACAAHGIEPVFQDFREQYPEATRRSKALGMYRQNYCGCAFSKVEAAEEREQRKAERAAAKAAKEAAEAPRRAAEEAERARNRAEKQAYNEKRQRQRALLKKMKEEAKKQAAE